MKAELKGRIRGDILTTKENRQIISFELNDKKKDINFSPGLNVIIGKRGSGKSLLLTIIENLNKSNNKLTTDYKEFNIKNILGTDYNGIKINLC